MRWHTLADSHVNNAVFISWTLPHQHRLSLDPARQAALFAFIHNMPDCSCAEDPSGLQRDCAELHWLYSAGATTPTVVNPLARRTLYRLGNEMLIVTAVRKV